MQVRILNIGNEVLQGIFLNTNSTFLGQELFKLGYKVADVRVIGDEKIQIENEIDDFLNSNLDILITTGGLGPTHDDITKEVIAKKLNLEMVQIRAAARNLKKYFPSEIPKCNQKVAYFPRGATILPNDFGSACGAIIEANGKIIILLVGPPYELEPMFNNNVHAYLKNLQTINYEFKEYLITGIKESELEDLLQGFYKKYHNLSMATYASNSLIRFEVIYNRIDRKFFAVADAELKEILGEHLIGDKGLEIEDYLYSLLRKHKLTISFAESCTGGLLAAQLINVSGASKIFGESLVTYSNEAKQKYLQVNKRTLNRHGAVSKEVVTEMATGLAKLTGSDITVSVSGIAGPTGGTRNKPVGLVHFAIQTPSNIYTEEQIFSGDRQTIRNRTVNHIFGRIIYYIKKEIQSK